MFDCIKNLLDERYENYDKRKSCSGFFKNIIFAVLK